MRIITSPTVQLGLDLQYPATRLIRNGLQFVGIHRRHQFLLTFQQTSTADLLAPFALRPALPVPDGGSLRPRLLRGLRPTHTHRSATDLPTTAPAARREGERRWFPRSRII